MVHPEPNRALFYSTSKGWNAATGVIPIDQSLMESSSQTTVCFSHPIARWSLWRKPQSPAWSRPVSLRAFLLPQ